MKRTLSATATAACLMLTFATYGGTAHAQQMSMPMGHTMPDTASGHAASASAPSESPSTAAYRAAEDKMMKNMDAPYVGDADQDFVSHMMPHHEGAVAMAEVELKYGKDPQLKKLARNIIKAQDEEIAFMKRWQAKHPVK